METIELIKIQDMMNDLKKSINGIAEAKNVAPRPTRSDVINDLATALAKAQSEMKVADLNKVNPYFKSRYADFTSVVETSRSSLTKHGLSVTQQILHDENA